MYCSMSSKLSNFLLRNQLLWHIYVIYIWHDLIFFPLTAFNILSLFYIVKCLNYDMQSDMLFWSCIFGILYASCACLGVYFHSLGEFSPMISWVRTKLLPLHQSWVRKPNMGNRFLKVSSMPGIGSDPTIRSPTNGPNYTYIIRARQAP